MKSELGGNRISEVRQPDSGSNVSELVSRLNNPLELSFPEKKENSSAIPNDTLGEASAPFLAEGDSVEQRKLEVANLTGRDVARFDGEAGNSPCRPNLETERGRHLHATMEKFGQTHVDYVRGEVNFDPFSLANVSIEGMSTNRQKNFRLAREALASQWNAERKDGRSDWKPADVKKWARDNGLTIHEHGDTKTCQFVPTEIHESFRHTGGVFECGLWERNGVAFDD